MPKKTNKNKKNKKQNKNLKNNKNKNSSQNQMTRKKNVPNSMGAKIGSQVGDFLQKGATAMFKSITGFGDYKVRSNTLLSGASPAVFRGGDRSTVVRHREFVQDVTGSTTFSSTSYAVNPGNATLFPWLAAVASCYEQYNIHGMIFEYKSTSADSLNSTNTALGTVCMATQYNVLNPAFTNKIQMQNYEFATSCRPSDSMMHPLECDPSQTPTNIYYTSPSATGGDLRFVNMANFQIATVGMQSPGTIIGELWLSFEIELLKPRLSSVIAGTLTYNCTAYNPVSSTNLFTSPSAVANTGYPGALIFFTATTIQFTQLLPGSVYQILLIVKGTATGALVAPTVSAITGGVQSLTYEPDSNGGTGMSAGSSTDTRAISYYCFLANSATVTLGYSGSTLPSSSTMWTQFSRCG